MIQGPDPDPVKPTYQMPAGACDAHCHIYGPQSRFPYVAGGSYLPPDAPFEQMRALHEFLGFDRAVIVQPNPHGADNSATLDGIARSEGRYRGVAVVRDGVSDRDLQALHDGGIRGIRFTFLARLGGGPDLAAFERLCAQVKPLGWHVVLYFGPGDLPQYVELIDRMSVPFVIDHMGTAVADQGLEQPAFQALLKIMRNPLAWVKVTGPERISTQGPPFHDAIPFARTLIEAAPDRVIWGTDWPHPNVQWMPNDGELVNLFARFTDDETLRHQVLVDNPTRLYWPELL
jgi:predicted TIM-barrel fold metal-dependent hydrolase